MLKLVSDEEESEELWRVIDDAALFASELVLTEVPRGLGRRDPSGTWCPGWDRLAAALRLVQVDRVLLRTAADLAPAALRSLDAIHLASALTLGDAIAGVLVYDQRLALACESHGLAVLSPGAKA